MCFRAFNRQLLAVCKEVTLRLTIHIRSLINYECVLLAEERRATETQAVSQSREQENFSPWKVEEGELIRGGLVPDGCSRKI